MGGSGEDNPYKVWTLLSLYWKYRTKNWVEQTPVRDSWVLKPPVRFLSFKRDSRFIGFR